MIIDFGPNHRFRNHRFRNSVIDFASGSGQITPFRIVLERTSRPPSRIIWERTPRPPSRIILGATSGRAADGGKRAASHTALPTYISKDPNFSSPAARHATYTPKFYSPAARHSTYIPKKFSPAACHSTYTQKFRLRRAILLIQKLGGPTEHN